MLAGEAKIRGYTAAKTELRWLIFSPQHDRQRCPKVNPAVEQNHKWTDNEL